MPWLRSWHGAWYGSVRSSVPKCVSSWPLIVQVEQELPDVPGRVGDCPGVGVVEVEHLAVLGLEGVGAGRGGADDPVAGASVAGEHGQVIAGPTARRPVEPVADQRQAAADLRRNDHLEAVPLQHVDRGLADMRLVVVGGAAVEVDDRVFGWWSIRRPGRAAVPG